MEIVRGLHNVRPHHRGAVITIGNFDGVHLGHRAILEQLAAIGADAGAPTTLVTFEPHPGEFFSRGAAPARLTRFREKMRALSRSSLQSVLVLGFDHDFSMTPAETFVRRYLVEGLGVKHLLVGDDFRFGHGAEGDFSMLQTLSGTGGFALSRRETFALNGERVSSTRIRQALTTGDLGTAGRLLGRPYSMLGRAVRG
ncbi:MAG TPA: bifunctional riboflavin kinase/FAD synthetase, partial [Gammaproteobacteria bacterium]